MCKIVQLSRNVLEVRFNEINADWEQWIMLSGDRHHDNLRCDRKREKRDLDLAQERNALIVDVGDLFCAMQGKYDRRSRMDEIRPEDVGEDYLDRIVLHAADFYGPYAKNFLLLGRGNHEASIRNRHGVDLLSNLAHRLNVDYGGNVHTGGYGGWVFFRFKYHKTSQTTRRLKYFHGAGGGGPVTRGVIQTNRQAVYLPDADFVANGHTEDAWHVIVPRERVTQSGKVTHDVAHYVRTVTYHDAYLDGHDGFHVEKWMAPKAIGCAWIRFFLQGHNIEADVTVKGE